MARSRKATEKPRLPRHAAFFAGLAAGTVALAIAFVFAPVYAVGIAVSTMFAVYLGIVILELPRLSPAFLKKHADSADTPVGLILLATVAAIVAAVASLFLALAGSDVDVLAVAVSIVSVALSWFAIHAMAGLHYAYEYYQADDGGSRRSGIVGGLEFPGEEPDGSAFLYLGYTLGAAMQVSDIEPTTNAMRRLMLVHTTFAFFFNTVLVAATVNVVITLVGG